MRFESFLKLVTIVSKYILAGKVDILLYLKNLNKHIFTDREKILCISQFLKIKNVYHSFQLKTNKNICFYVESPF